MINKIQEILEGWKNHAFPTPEVEAIAKTRLSICSTCPIFNNGYCSKNRSMKAEINFTYENEERFSGTVYKGCGCPTEKKCRSINSKCPLGRW